MKSLGKKAVILILLSIAVRDTGGQDAGLLQEAENAMLRATKYMVENVSTNGGYVWYYMPDMSRRWGEMEAYKTMVWVQGPGTVSMGHLFLDAYQATGNEFYYQAAVKAASALVWGQNHEGGWNYMIDFGGDRSLKQWYATIGKNGWRLEEFQHYYGNSTFDDDVTSNAARLLLRIYLVKLDPIWKSSLDKAVSFILESQYPLGGWPQRYPLKYDFNKEGHPDYTSFYTFNDGVVWENVNFLIQCYQTLGEQRFLDPVMRGMNFFLLSQDSSGGWAQQLTLDLQPAGARTYEPKALLPSTTYENASILLTFYRYTGDRRFLQPVASAIRWLDKTRLPADKTDNGRYTHPTFIEPGTNRPVYVHRKGSNVIYGKYYADYNDDKLLSHYGGKRYIRTDNLKQDYKKISALPPDELTKDSPLKIDSFKADGTPQSSYNPYRNSFSFTPNELQVKQVIQSLGSDDRWLVKHVSISNSYKGDGIRQDMTDEFASTNVGDETDTSPYRDPSDNEYISTSEYIRNMTLLIMYVRSQKPAPKK